MVHVRSHRLAPDIIYQVHPDHRNGTRGKSQWTISEQAELDMFDNVLGHGRLHSDVGWGLYIDNGRVDYLGVAQDHYRKVFVAKFVDGSQNNCWHGYPADHQRNVSDIPAPYILQEWLDANLLRCAVIRKIMRGQPCNL